MMKRNLLAALAVTVTGMFGAAPADAQDYPDWRFDIGVNGGLGAYTSMLDDDHLGEDTEDVRFGPGWLTGAQITGWFTPRIGLRANGLYTERPIIQGGMFDTGEEFNLMEDVNIWQVTGDLLFRLTSGEARARPYLALGVGGSYFDHGEEILLSGTEGGDDEVRGLPFSPATGDFALVEEWKLTGLVGLGTDVRLARNVGLRVEVGDRIFDAPLRNFPLTDPDEDVGKVIHNPYAQLGLHLLLGVREPEVIVAPPPPPPPPAPEPAPEPEPVEEQIQVCVVDPSAPTGLTTMDAVYLPETRDTMVVQAGERVAFATVVPDVTVADEADWFVRGEPLTIDLAGPATIEYTTWQSARMIEADQLVMIGTSRGLPVYASVEDVSDIRMEWEAARTAAGSDELDDIVAENAALAAELEDIEFLYVPLRPTGCVFQTVRVVEQVQKK